ncbi:MAG: methyltransferase domain-containing protein, partial [Bacteroidales bacterium]|nr:methyltransferase domain-containing protein [Bacteroidales bacterium]
LADLTKFREEGKYHLVLCVDVMEHILDDVEVFRNYSFSMKDGGILLISTPSDQGGSDVHDDHKGSFIEEHVREGYNITDIIKKLKTAGFSEVRARYSYGWPGRISWRLSMKYPIIMLNTSRLFFILIPFYYLLTFPVSMLLNILDVRLKHKTGTGLIVKAVN